jgi:hypothetical protein
MSADLLTKLIEAGTPANLVAEVAMELGRAEAERQALAKRRESDRERKAKSREVTSCHVTGCDTSDNTPLDGPPSPQTPHPPLNPPKLSTAAPPASGFDEFWVSYPKREGDNPRKPAVQAYQRALKRAEALGYCAADLLIAAKRYAGKHPGRSPYVAQAVTWLNQDRWQDELESSKPATSKANGWPLSWAEETCRDFYLRGSWPAGIGCPAPGQPGCKVPTEIQQRWQAEKAAQRSAA